MLKAKLKRFNNLLVPKLPEKAIADNSKKNGISPVTPRAAEAAEARVSASGTKHIKSAFPSSNQLRGSRSLKSVQFNQKKAYGSLEKLPSSATLSGAESSHASAVQKVSVANDSQARKEKKELVSASRKKDVISNIDKEIAKFEGKLNTSLSQYDDDDQEEVQQGDQEHDGEPVEVGEKISAVSSALDETVIDFIKTKASLNPVQHMKILATLVAAPEAKKDQSKKYLEKIRTQRVEEEYSRKDREQRRRKIILGHQQAQQEIQKKHTEELLLSKLMRQSKQERRIAEQLIQIRHEKDVMHENRVFREQQYAERRQKDYEDAISREYELCEKARAEYKEQCALQLAQHREILNAKRAAKHAKNIQYCNEIVKDIITYAFKVAEYRALNDNKDVPLKKQREWKTLFKSGQNHLKPGATDSKSDTLIEHHPKPAVEATLDAPVSHEVAVRVQKPSDDVDPAIDILDKVEFNEYIAGIGNWPLAGTPNKNPILGFIVDEVIRLTIPPEPGYDFTRLPDAPLRLALIGKTNSGRKTMAKLIAGRYHTSIIVLDDLIDEAVRLSDPAVSKRLGIETPSKEFKPPKFVLSKQQIGAKIEAALLEGQNPDDSLLVSLVVDALTSPTNSKPGGTLLVGFPRTKAQAQLLERELSGYEDPKPIKKGDLKRTPDRPPSQPKTRSLIAPLDVYPDSNEAPPKSALDSIFLLEVSNQAAISRSVGQRVDPVTGRIYHIEFDPPPTNAPGTFERLSSPEDESKTKAQLHFQLAAFEDEQQPLKEWLTRFQTLHVVDANQSPEKSFEVIKTVLDDIIDLKIQKTVLEQRKAEEAREAQREAEEAKKALEEERPVKATSSPTHSAGFKEKIGSAAHEPSPQPVVTVPEPKSKGTAAAQANSAKDGKAALAAPVIHDTPSIMDYNIEIPAHHLARTVTKNGRHLPSKELAAILIDQWATIESSYTDAIKFAFRSIRKENDVILRYFFEAKVNFKTFLERPDMKQDLIDLFQTEFNAVEDDLRCDNDAKAELHQRVEDLRDKLWEISDKKREEADSERMSLIEDKWVEDHSYILANIYISMFQAEVERYIGSRQVIVDFYRDANNHILTEPAKLSVRINLIGTTAPPPVDIASVLVSAHEAQAAQRRDANPTAQAQQAAQTKKAPATPAPAASGKDSGKKGQAAAASKAPPVEPVAAKHTPGTPAQQTLPEKEHIVVDYENVHFQDLQNSYEAALSCIVTKESSVDIQFAEKKDKKKEEVRIEELHDSVPEHLQALDLEEKILRARLERIHKHAIEHLKDLRTKGFEAFILLDDWIGARFQAEMDATRDMTNIIKDAIECEMRLPNQLVLEGDSFKIDFGLLTLEPEPEPRPESPVEKTNSEQFTVLQLLNLGLQFRATAPTGRIGTKYFLDYLQKLSALSSSTELLPENFYNAEASQFQQLCAQLDTFETGTIDWHKFLLLNGRILSAPLPFLVQMRKDYDQFNKTKILYDEYQQVPLWFEEEYSSEGRVKQFNRTSKMKQALFQIFGEVIEPKSTSVDEPVVEPAPTSEGEQEAPPKPSLNIASPPQVSLVGEHDSISNDSIVFNVYDFLACSCLDESGMSGIEKAFYIFGNYDGECTAQQVYDALHYFLVLSETSHRLDSSKIVDDPFPLVRLY